MYNIYLIIDLKKHIIKIIVLLQINKLILKKLLIKYYYSINLMIFIYYKIHYPILLKQH